MRRLSLLLGCLLAVTLTVPTRAEPQPIPPMSAPADAQSGDPAYPAAVDAIATPTPPATATQDTTTESRPPVASGEPTIQAATHPKAHEATPLLPTKVTDGWTLCDLAPTDRPVPFLEAKGFQAHYGKAGEGGATLTMAVDILQIANASEAETIYDRLSTIDQLGSTTETLEMTGLKKIVFRQGTQDSPAASAQAVPLQVRRVVAWFPPFVVRFESQNAPFGVEEVKSILASLAWRQ